MRKLFMLLAVVIFLMVGGCSGSGPLGLGYEDCEDDMEDVVANRGSPEEINRYDSDSYHSVDYWYWSQGICYTFTWDTSAFSCEVSTYTFPPIGSVERTFQDQDRDSSVLIFEVKGQYTPILRITYIGAIEIPIVTVITEDERYDVELASVYFLEGVVLHGVIDKPTNLVSVCVDNICIDF